MTLKTSSFTIIFGLETTGGRALHGVQQGAVEAERAKSGRLAIELSPALDAFAE